MTGEVGGGSVPPPERFRAVSSRLWGALKLFRQASALETLIFIWLAGWLVGFFQKGNLAMVFHLEL